MKKKILIGIIIILVLVSSIFIIFLLGKKEEKQNNPVTSDITTTTETSEITEVTTEITTLVTEKPTTVTTKKTTSKKTTTTLDYKTIKETQSEETTKYGTIIKDNYEITYKVYNDGRKEEKSRKKKKTTIDSTNYNATTSDLKDEAISVKALNKGTYNEMLSYVNGYRSEVNVSPLSIDDDLNLAATIRAIEMAYSKKFSHFRPDGNMCYSIAEDLNLNVNSMGENIAYGQKTAACVSEVWRNSDGHYGNMINTMFARVGFGKYTLNGKTYWVQIFAG